MKACAGICHRHRAPAIRSDSRYASGHRRCTRCDEWFLDAVRCPCCLAVLRSRPRKRGRKTTKKVNICCPTHT